MPAKENWYWLPPLSYDRNDRKTQSSEVCAIELAVLSKQAEIVFPCFSVTAYTRAGMDRASDFVVLHRYSKDAYGNQIDAGRMEVCPIVIRELYAKVREHEAITAGMRQTGWAKKEVQPDDLETFIKALRCVFPEEKLKIEVEEDSRVLIDILCNPECDYLGLESKLYERFEANNILVNMIAAGVRTDPEAEPHATELEAPRTLSKEEVKVLMKQGERIGQELEAKFTRMERVNHTEARQKAK